jgi:hypothetical protein
VTVLARRVQRRNAYVFDSIEEMDTKTLQRVNVSQMAFERLTNKLRC